MENRELEGSQKQMKMSLYQTLGKGNQEVVGILEHQKKVEVELLEQKYKELLQKTEQEYKQFLEEVDKTLLEQEDEIDELKKISIHHEQRALVAERKLEEYRQRLLQQEQQTELIIQENKNEKDLLRNDMEYLNNEMETIDNTLQSLRAELVKRESDLNERDGRIQTLLQKNQSFEHEIKKILIEKEEQFAEERERVGQELLDLQNQATSWTLYARKVERTVAARKIQQFFLRRENARLSSGVGQQRAQTSFCKEQIQKLLAEVSGLQGQVQEYQTAILRIEQESQIFAAENRQLQAENDKNLLLMQEKDQLFHQLVRQNEQAVNKIQRDSQKLLADERARLEENAASLRLSLEGELRAKAQDWERELLAARERVREVEEGASRDRSLLEAEREQERGDSLRHVQEAQQQVSDLSRRLLEEQARLSEREILLE